VCVCVCVCVCVWGLQWCPLPPLHRREVTGMKLGRCGSEGRLSATTKPPDLTAFYFSTQKGNQTPPPPPLAARLRMDRVYISAFIGSFLRLNPGPHGVLYTCAHVCLLAARPSLFRTTLAITSWIRKYRVKWTAGGFVFFGPKDRTKGSPTPHIRPRTITQTSCQISRGPNSNLPLRCAGECWPSFRNESNFC